MMRWLILAALVAGGVALGPELSACRTPDANEETVARAEIPAAVVTPAIRVESEIVEVSPEAIEETQEEATAAPTASGDERTPRFIPNAFPPVLPDTDRHQRAWLRDDCMRCHETGVELAPMVKHAGMPDILLTAKCRSCHVLIPGTPVPPPKPVDPSVRKFADFAFPPMIPASGSHRDTWMRDDCLLCHEDGTKGAPIIKHEGMPRILLEAKCRSCHVQVRSVEASEKVRLR